MTNAQLNLIPIIFDQSSGRYKIYSSSKDKLDLVSYTVSEYLDINQTLEHILASCIKTELPVHNFKLVDISVSSKIDIYYIVFIMYDTIIKNGYSLNLTENILHEMPNNAKKIISLL